MYTKIEKGLYGQILEVTQYVQMPLYGELQTLMQRQLKNMRIKQVIHMKKEML
jgi:hypothetical protein